MSTATLEVVQTGRICHNCGFPQAHRLHEGGPCAYFFAQPQTLWTAVVQPAIWQAAEDNGLDSGDLYMAVYDHMARKFAR